MKGQFNFQCASSRPFKNYVDLVEQWQNFVFVSDAVDRRVKIYLLDERDLENDEETAVEVEVQGLVGKVVRMKFIPNR